MKIDECEICGEYELLHKLKDGDYVCNNCVEKHELQNKVLWYGWKDIRLKKLLEAG